MNPVPAPAAVHPAFDHRLILSPSNGRGVDAADAVRLSSSHAAQRWAEEVVGPDQAVRDVSHDRPNSRVWQLTCGTGRVFLKVAPTPTFYVRETRAYREAAPALETGMLPRLLETHAQQQSLLMTQVPGRNVQTLALTRAQQRAVPKRIWRAPET
ncbi:hypothetical protein OG548_43610 [Streptomyces sp. NBC_01356]|uniref:hypothetical protein n=1 Tax=Streptomyces sp. NBC_01356 TaxID=2903836 RepID=UPI002E344813|nr:hypothetical protein [Streptomyces sp. NBC_01356]